jgi:hypothetical protein
MTPACGNETDASLRQKMRTKSKAFRHCFIDKRRSIFGAMLLA